MLSAILVLSAAAPAQAGPTQTAPDSTPRECVLELLEESRKPCAYDLELRLFEVDYGCDLGRALMAHVERSDAASAEAALDAIDFIEESADVDTADAPVREFEDRARRSRVWDGGSRRMVETLGPDGARLSATLIDGERRARYVAARDALQLGPLGEAPALAATETDLFPVPARGPWLRALERTTWIEIEPGNAWRAAMDRDGRRLDVTFDLSGDEGQVPHRAVATYYGVRSTSYEAVLLSWEEVDGQLFLAESVRITPGDDSIVVRHARRSAPRFNLSAKDVRLSIPRPEAVEIASSPGWRSFRRREMVPREWRDLISIEAR